MLIWTVVPQGTWVVVGVLYFPPRRTDGWRLVAHAEVTEATLCRDLRRLLVVVEARLWTLAAGEAGEAGAAC